MTHQDYRTKFMSKKPIYRPAILQKVACRWLSDMKTVIELYLP